MNPRRLLSATLLLLLAVLASGCASRTEVIVAVESDILDLDRISIVVTSPTGAMQTANATFGTGARDLVRTLGVTYSQGPLGPFVATATGSRAGTQVVARSAIFEFVRGQTRVIHLDLLGSCVGRACGASQTCGESGCRAEMLAPSELEPYTGTITSHDVSTLPDGGPASDAGRDGGMDAGRDATIVMVDAGHDAGNDAFVAPIDAGSDAPVCIAELCNMLDDDCDGMIDEGFMLQTDPANCGMCGIDCATLPHSTGGTCGAGRCRIGTCDPGFLDCDGRNSTGCEVNQNTNSANCGMCGMRCLGTTMMCCMGICTATCP